MIDARLRCGFSFAPRWCSSSSWSAGSPASRAGNPSLRMRPQPEARRLAILASAGLGLVLLVVLVSVAIRLGQAATPPLGAGAMLALRAMHRSAASLEVLVVLWLAWLAWRGRSARPAFARGGALALAITLFLSVLGIAAGQ